ncbi:hypothetical protein L3X38_031304 [Prunus dulcis]|uniref:Uncharacterized protein n=1 Tax=Prunus dulcis TaxID=3755 RepID=A0AAD4VE39_PRUDU|nr:hypothetical protein L3X38_031304 [Prunus dulcis]
MRPTSPDKSTYSSELGRCSKVADVSANPPAHIVEGQSGIHINASKKVSVKYRKYMETNSDCYEVLSYDNTDAHRSHPIIALPPNCAKLLSSTNNTMKKTQIPFQFVNQGKIGVANPNGTIV